MRLLRIVGTLTLAGIVWADDPIRLKTRTIDPPRTVRSGAWGRHLVLRFESRPGPRLLAELAHRRIRVLAYLPDSALMVAVDGQPDLSGLGVTWAGPLDAADKISPLLAQDRGDVYLAMF